MREPNKPEAPQTPTSVRVVERMDHSPKWGVIVPVLFIFIVLIFWQQLYDVAKDKAVAVEEALLSDEARHRQEAEQRAQRQAAMKKTTSFEDQLSAALRFDREGNRAAAHSVFSKLLKEAAKNPGYNENIAALLPRAADFYSRGDEIPMQQIEYLYLDAADAVKRVHGNNYYDFENIHRGLEKFYQKHNRFEHAAGQTRALLQFYKRHYTDENVWFYMAYPTTIRLGSNLLAAGKPEAARATYESAIALAKTHNYPAHGVEYLIQKTWEEDTVGELPTVPASAMGMQMAIPMSNADKQRLAEEKQTARDLKPVIEAIRIDGLVVETIQQAGRDFNVRGYADDNRTVAAFMRRLQNEVGDPKLHYIKRGERDGKSVNEFVLTVQP